MILVTSNINHTCV